MSARQHLQVIVAAVMTTLTVALSVHGLAEIATRGDAPTVQVGGWAFPLGHLAFIGCLDGMAFMAALAPKHEAADLVVLIGAHLASAVLQYVAAPPAPWAKIVHTGPVLMTGVAIWSLFRSLSRRPAGARPVLKAGRAVTAENRSARNVAGTTPASTTVAPPPPAAGVPGSDGDRKAPSSGRQGLHLAPPPGAAPSNDGELATRVASELAKRDMAPSRRNVAPIIRGITGSCSTDLATIILNLIKTGT